MDGHAVATIGGHSFWWQTASPLLAFVLGVAVPVGLTEGGVDAQPTSYWIVFSVAAYAGIRLAFSLISAYAVPMRLGFWVYCYLFLGLAPVVQISSDKFPLSATPTSVDATTAGVVIWIGLATYEVTYHFVGRRPRPGAATGIDIAWARRITAASIVVTVLFVAAIGPSLFSTREEFSARAAAVFGSITSTGAVAISLGTVPIAVALLVAFERRRRGHVAVGVLGVLVVLNLATANVFSTPRFWLGTVALSVLLSIGASAGRPRRIRVLVLACLFGFVIVFPIADTFRRVDTAKAGIVETGITEQFTSMDYDSFQQIATGVALVRQTGVQLGKQLAGSALFLIPRDLWPAKPLGTGALLAESVGADYTNLSAPLWVEGYVDFGLVGTAVLLGTLGALSVGLDRRFASQVGQGGGVWMVVVPLVGFYQLILLRGSLIVVMPRLSVLLLCAWLLAERRTTRQRRGCLSGSVEVREADSKSSGRADCGSDGRENFGPVGAPHPGASRTRGLRPPGKLAPTGHALGIT